MVTVGCLKCIWMCITDVHYRCDRWFTVGCLKCIWMCITDVIDVSQWDVWSALQMCITDVMGGSHPIPQFAKAVSCISWDRKGLPDRNKVLRSLELVAVYLNNQYLVRLIYMQMQHVTSWTDEYWLKMLFSFQYVTLTSLGLTCFKQHPLHFVHVLLGKCKW